ncbi:MAG: hypothetical protein WDN04_15070 [Rhodospirillales bacterium]
MASVGAPQAALVAGREEHAGGAARCVLDARAGPTRGSRRSPRRRLVAPGVAALLARLLARLPHRRRVARHRCSFCRAGPAERAAGIANSIACAASLLVGRTLLLDAHPHGRMPGDADLHSGLLPDAFLPGLYHRRIGGVRSRGSAFFAPDILAAHTAEARQFRSSPSTRRRPPSRVPHWRWRRCALVPFWSCWRALRDLPQFRPRQRMSRRRVATSWEPSMADPQMNFPRTISA